MVDWISNSCGGARFRTLPDHRIEIEGMGVPVLDPSSALYRQLAQTWANWSGPIRRNARRTGIPPSYLLAVATKETGLYSADKARQATIGSPAGAVGVMQVMPCAIFQREPYKSLVCTRDRANPDDSFYIGATLLAEKVRALRGLPPAASSYNAGSLKCATGQHASNVFNWHHEHDYSFLVTQLNNTAIERLRVNEPELLKLFIGSAALVGGAIFLYAKRSSLRRLMPR
jgi:hypothetical protein